MQSARLPFTVLVASVLALAGIPASGGDVPCGGPEMPGLAAAWSRVSAGSGQPQPAMGGAGTGAVVDARLAAEWDDFSRIATAILGLRPAEQGEVLADVGSALARGSSLPQPCSASQRGRDRVAWQLMATGYSGAEIADILSGRLSKADVDGARRLLLAGYGAAQASAFLDAAMTRRERERAARAEARRAASLRRQRRPQGGVLAFRAGSTPPVLASAATLSLGNASLQDAIGKYSALYGVNPALVEAIVGTESGFDPGAVSPRGAMGLMQLMPATARMLGVNPRDPIENLRGGIAYFAGLLRQYGDVASALVAYNAGPTHLERVRRGEAVLYGETRQYLERIAVSLPGVRSGSDTLFRPDGGQVGTGYSLPPPGSGRR